MKIQKRVGLFETNSSSEHTVTISDSDCFERWRRGELAAKVKTCDKCNETQGNFWSTSYTLEFTEPGPETEKYNLIVTEDAKKRDIADLERWKKLCEEAKSYTNPEDKEEERYIRGMYRFDQEYYDKTLAEYKAMTPETYHRFHSLLDIPGFWMTWEEFTEEFNLDCYSTYEHTVQDGKLKLFGKYFHS